jgi:hypothetical protein
LCDAKYVVQNSIKHWPKNLTFEKLKMEKLGGDELGTGELGMSNEEWMN